MQLLDFGCGSGLVAMHLYKEAGSVVLLDSSTGMLNVLREKIGRHHISNMKVIQGEIDDPSLEAGSFDLIYMCNVLHHIEDVPPLLDKLRRLLTPDGHLCIGDLVKESGAFHQDHTAVWHFGFEKSELCETVRSSGFGNIHWEEYHTIRKPDPTGTMREYPLFFMSAVKA